MKVLSNDSIICFDVDNTLIHGALGRNGLKIKHSRYGIQYVVPIKEHIDLLIDYANQDKTIVVWSATGYEWASKIVKALKLNKYVDLVMSKPYAYVDDLDIEDWIGKRIYVSDY